jgi:nucleoside-diphosphate-sugar epimerase
MCYAYAQQEKVQVRVARIFNTFGPRMNLNDGRVVSNFILQSLQKQNITVEFFCMTSKKEVFGFVGKFKTFIKDLR